MTILVELLSLRPSGVTPGVTIQKAAQSRLEGRGLLTLGREELAMKTLLRIASWILVAAAIVWWPTRPTSFQTRWVSMPAAMSWDTISKARKASARPSFCAYEFQTHWHNGRQCRIG
jgi:hypothetical protein